MNVRGSVHWKGVNSVGKCTLGGGGGKFFKLIITIDLSETTKSCMFKMPLRLNNHK